jgi:hypothetical protein
MPRPTSKHDTGAASSDPSAQKFTKSKLFQKPTEVGGIALSPTKKREMSPLERKLNEESRKQDAQPKKEPKPMMAKIRGTGAESQKAREAQAGTHFDRVAKAVLIRHGRDAKTDLPFFTDLKKAILDRSAKEADVEAHMVKTMNEIVETDRQWNTLVGDIAKRSGYKDSEISKAISQKLTERKAEILRSALLSEDRTSKKPVDFGDAVDEAMAKVTREIKTNLREKIGSPAIHEKLMAAEVAVQLLQATQESEIEQDEDTVIELEDEAHKAIDAWALAAYEDNESISPAQLLEKAKQHGFDKLITKTRFDKLIREQKAEQQRRLQEADEVRTKGPKLDEIDPVDDIVTEGAGMEQRELIKPTKPTSVEEKFFGPVGRDLEGEPKSRDKKNPLAEPKPKSIFQKIADVPSSAKAALLGGLAVLGSMFFDAGQQREDIPETTPYADIVPDTEGMTMNADEDVSAVASGREVQYGDIGNVSAGEEVDSVEVEQATKQQLERRAKKAEEARKKSFESLMQEINDVHDQFEFDSDETTLKLAEILGTQGLQMEAFKIKQKRGESMVELLRSFDDILQQQEGAGVRTELATRALKISEDLRATLAKKAAEKAKVEADKKVAQDAIDNLFRDTDL